MKGLAFNATIFVISGIASGRSAAPEHDISTTDQRPS
jgi:hypothetical protein